MGKIALSMIVAGTEKPENLRRCLMSAADYVDGVFVTVTTKKPDDKLDRIVEDFEGTLSYEPKKFFHKVTKKEHAWLKKFFKREPKLKAGDKVFQFDAARNHSMEIIPKDYEWMLWLDVDDVLRNGKMLPEVVKQMEQNQVDAGFLNYIYQAEFNEDGSIQAVLIEHLRERVVRLDGSYEWVAPIHETLIEKRPTKKVDFKEIDVLHMSSQERMETALRRNLKALEYSIYVSRKKDPRPIYYLGKALFDMATHAKDTIYYDQALPLFLEYLNGEAKSGWPDERAQCWEYISEIYRHRNQINNAIKCLHNAIIEAEKPTPSTFVGLGVLYLLQKKWDKALFWVKIATKIDQPKNTLVTNPRDIQSRALEVVYHVSINTSKLDEAWASAQKLAELLPGNEEMQNRLKFTQQLRAQRELTKDFVSVARHLNAFEKEKLAPLAMAVPEFIADNPIIADLRKQITPPKTWGDNEIAIYCGPGATPWSPENLENPGKAFIGGSEEAVIYLTQELAQQGWSVTVYSDVGANEGEYNGVNWVPYYRFNGKDDFNILIYWRRPGLLDKEHKAKKIYVWAHDILNNLEFTEERIKKLHKVIVLSPWHRKNIPSVPDSKVLISGNGIHV